MPPSQPVRAADDEPRFNLLAPVLAWLVPGLGHASLGYRRRGLYLLISIAALYLGGLLIGGVDVIDRRENRWWYYGQTLAGPVTPLVDLWLSSQLVHVDDAGRPLAQPMKPAPALPADHPDHDPGYRPAFSVSLGRINEVGTLFTTLAGMLNLIAILDVIYLAPAAASAAAGAAAAAAAAGAVGGGGAGGGTSRASSVGGGASVRAASEPASSSSPSSPSATSMADGAQEPSTAPSDETAADRDRPR